jgi:uncharacterized protein YyaL (SSP411 family)
MSGILLLAAALSVPAALPGAEPFPDGLRRRLEAELAARGPGHTPRTRHLDPDGKPAYTNRLLLEASPYLQQHAHNPVDWHAWGDHAFERARRLGRPLLVSVGYSTCHWCHVMEEESYDNPEVAAFLNRHFIAIKVDREERPDVDSVYMSALQAMRGQGGWPLNVWVTADREPFYGATYLPRERFLDALRAIVRGWEADREEVHGSAGRLRDHLRQSLAGSEALASHATTTEPLGAAVAWYKGRYDRSRGGLRAAHKFPASLPIRLLLRHHRRSGDPETLRMAVFTLERMADGGIRDQLGGGFHRYAVDPDWHVPHFEKMLYDNALLTLAYMEAWQATGREAFADVARDTLDYLAREMSAPHGGFYSATDADSPAPDGEMEEGLFFTWTRAELRSVLGDAADPVIAYWGVGEERSVPRRLGKAPPPGLETARTALYRARARRPAPLRDEKILAAWNGLAISAFARAGFALSRPDYTARAERAVDFVLSKRRADGRLRRVQSGDGPSFLEDHAFVVAGLLDLYEASRNPRWLREALAVQAAQDAHYADTTGGGYFRTADDADALLVREKPARYGAVPSGNSVAALNLLRLHAFTTDPIHLQQASLLLSAFHETLTSRPSDMAELLLAVDFATQPTREVVVVSGDGLDALLAPLRTSLVPNRILAVVEPDQIDTLSSTVPLVRNKVARGGRATAYVCRNRVCDAPTEDAAVLARQLSQVTPLTAPGKP